MKTKLLIFGITGDLSRRKLLPALSEVVASHESPELEIIGVSRRDVSISELVSEYANLQDITTMHTMNLAHIDDYKQLASDLALKSDEQLLVYLSVPPAQATTIADFLGEAGLNGSNVKLLFEKPFGVDLESAKDLIERTERYYSEDQLYRIDHYLAKEMAQNLVAFRASNALLSTIWNNRHIESIEIVAYEDIDIQQRAQFYEQIGALRDVLQGHLMQLAALTLMDVPHDLDWNELPERRLEALNQLRVVQPGDALRAQYEGYKDEVDSTKTTTETFVRLKLESDADNWKGVPIWLATGKATGQKTTEIRINLRREHDTQSNQIVFRVQPNEGVYMDLAVKKPGYEHAFSTKQLGFSFPEDTDLPDAYEHVLIEAMRSRKSLFTSGAEVLRSWEVLEDVQRAWSFSDEQPVIYKKGTLPAL